MNLTAQQLEEKQKELGLSGEQLAKYLVLVDQDPLPWSPNSDLIRIIKNQAYEGLGLTTDAQYT